MGDTVIVLTGRSLTLDEVVRVAREGARVELDAVALETMRASRLVVERALEREDDVYGLTTVVGDQRRFNSQLIDGHRIGQGEVASEEVARATMLRLANGLAQGAPGARPELAQVVVDALNDGAKPHIRILGSVGQADLAANADLASGLVGDFELEAGEALALLNNNAFSTALASLAVADLATLLDALDVAGALDLDAYAVNTSF